MNLEKVDAVAIAAAVRSGKVSAVEVVKATLQRIAARDIELNCFTAVTAETALADAERIDREIAQGKNIGPLAGVQLIAAPYNEALILRVAAVLEAEVNQSANG